MFQSEDIKHCVVIGSSKGLGAALVEELLSQTSYQIIGIARTSFENIENYHKWHACGRYRHIELNISSPASSENLKSLCSEFDNKKLCVIFNAALVKTEINRAGAINYAILREVNYAGVDGLSNVLAAFGDYLSRHGGVLVGISSFSAFIPPFLEPRIAYPASKAYLDMVFRCLRILWGKNVNVVVVHLGHLGNSKNGNSVKKGAVTYVLAAKKIIRSILRKKIPHEINYPIVYCIVYKYIFKFIPDSLYFTLSKFFIKKKK